jgi:hypothetical protein
MRGKKKKKGTKEKKEIGLELVFFLNSPSSINPTVLIHKPE